MSPAPRVATRLPLLGCVLALVAALAFSACGDDGSAIAENTTAPPPKHPVGASAGADRPCPTKLEGFVDSLDRLRHQLAVGLSYEQYAAKVNGLRASYDAIPVDRLSLGCLATTGTPAEDALNEYIDAANPWGECLADAACPTASIEPVLQGKWRVASRFLSEAE